MTIDDGLEIKRTTKLTMEDALSMVVRRLSCTMIAMGDPFSMEEERAGITVAIARKKGVLILFFDLFFFSFHRERERERESYK